MSGLKERKVSSYDKGRIHSRCISKLKEADEGVARWGRWRCSGYRGLTEGMKRYCLAVRVRCHMVINMTIESDPSLTFLKESHLPFINLHASISQTKRSSFLFPITSCCPASAAQDCPEPAYHYSVSGHARVAPSARHHASPWPVLR